MNVRCLLAAAALAAPGFAAAGEPVRWNCLYAPAEGEFIACQLLSAPIEGVAARPTSPGFERLPKLVKDIRNDPQSLDDRTVVIPLHNVPIDMSLTGRLAKAVMCGTRPDCEVSFHAERQGLVQATHTGTRPPGSRPVIAPTRK